MSPNRRPPRSPRCFICCVCSASTVSPTFPSSAPATGSSSRLVRPAAGSHASTCRCSRSSVPLVRAARFAALVPGGLDLRGRLHRHRQPAALDPPHPARGGHHRRLARAARGRHRARRDAQAARRHHPPRRRPPAADRRRLSWAAAPAAARGREVPRRKHRGCDVPGGGRARGLWPGLQIDLARPSPRTLVVHTLCSARSLASVSRSLCSCCSPLSRGGRRSLPRRVRRVAHCGGAGAPRHGRVRRAPSRTRRSRWLCRGSITRPHGPATAPGQRVSKQASRARPPRPRRAVPPSRGARPTRTTLPPHPPHRTASPSS